MTTRQRQGPDIDSEAYQKALDELERLLQEGEGGDDSDTTWQDGLPEAPDLPEDPGDTIAFVIPRGDGAQRPAWRPHMKTAHEDGVTAGQENKPTDYPRQQIMQMAQEALDRRGPGVEIHFQFTCPVCGSRCTTEEANVLYERGECYACGADSPIEQAGFILTASPVVGPLTPPVGNA